MNRKQNQPIARNANAGLSVVVRKLRTLVVLTAFAGIALAPPVAAHHEPSFDRSCALTVVGSEFNCISVNISGTVGHVTLWEFNVHFSYEIRTSNWVNPGNIIIEVRDVANAPWCNRLIDGPAGPGVSGLTLASGCSSSMQPLGDCANGAEIEIRVRATSTGLAPPPEIRASKRVNLC